MVYAIRKVTKALPKKPNMNALHPTLPNHDKLDKVKEIEDRLKNYPHLERCFFSLDSPIVKLREFYSEIGQLYGQDSESAFKEGLASLRKVLHALTTLKRINTRATRVLAWAEVQPEYIESIQLNPNLISEKQNNKFKKFTDLIKLILDFRPRKQRNKLIRINRILNKFNEMTLESYNSISDVVETSWDYLPVEVQDALHSLAQQIILKMPQFEQLAYGLSEDFLLERLNKGKNICNRLAISISTAAKNSKCKNKLELLKLLKNWDFSNNTPVQKSGGSIAITEIQEITENLAELSGVEQVKAVTHTPGDLHRTTFYLKLSVNMDKYGGFDTLEELFEVAERMALRAHRRLRESTGEKWYFHVSLDEDFSDYPNSNQIVAVAHAQSNNPPSAS